VAVGRRGAVPGNGHSSPLQAVHPRLLEKVVFFNGLLGETEATYDAFIIQYSRQKLVEIGFSKNARVIIYGMDLFNDANAFQALLRRDSCPYESYGFIILLNLGITLTGFHDSDPNQLAITAFVRGRWNDSKNEFRRFPVP